MKIKKIFNNNALLVEDEKQLEMILIGKGLGFGKKAGHEVDIDKVDKKFVIDSNVTGQQMIELLREVPINHLELSTKIIKNAEVELNVQFNDSIYVSLTDHLNYALYRYKQGTELKNVLCWEVKNFYPKEFKAGLNALKMIEELEYIKLKEDEASFLAQHFVNAQQEGEEMKFTIEMTEVVQAILSIVKSHYQIELDEDSLNYGRFITHIRYFIRRFVLKQTAVNEGDEFLYYQVKGKYPKSHECSLKVKKYLEAKFKSEMSYDEMLYFMIHINRVTNREKN